MSSPNGSAWTVLGATLTALPGWAQVIGAVLLIGGMAVTGYVTTEDIRETPERVDTVEQELSDYKQELSDYKMNLGHQISILSLDIRDNAETIQRLERKVDLVICMQEAQAGEHGYEQCAR